MIRIDPGSKLTAPAPTDKELAQLAINWFLAEAHRATSPLYDPDALDTPFTPASSRAHRELFAVIDSHLHPSANQLPVSTSTLAACALEWGRADQAAQASSFADPDTYFGATTQASYQARHLLQLALQARLHPARSL